MNVPREDLRQKIDTSMFHVVLLYSSGASSHTFEGYERLEDVLKCVYDRAAKGLQDPKFCGAVVIQGTTPQYYDAPTMRWLCGVGPKPDKKDPNWMGEPLGALNSGRTTKQIQDAPEGATFVWCREDLSYPLRIAQLHNRRDLRVVMPRWLEGEGLEMVRRAYRGVDIVLDHDVRLNQRQRETIQLNEYKKAK